MVKIVNMNHRDENPLHEETQVRMRAYFENTFQLSGLLDLDGRVLEVNKTAMDFIDGRKEDIIGKCLWDTPWWTHSPELQERLRLAIVKVGQGETVRFEATNMSKEKKVHYVDFSMKPLMDTRGNILYLISEARDISEYKKMADELWIINERYRAIMENTLLGIAVMDCNHRIIEVNARFSKMFNKEVSEFSGHYCYANFEKRKDICPHCPGVKAMAMRKTVEVETQGVLDDGSMFYAWNRAFPLFDRDGVVKGFIEVVEDVTAQKLVEKELKQAYDQLKMTQNQLVHVEKMASLGVLVAGIAHEINNPLGFIISNFEVVKTYLKSYNKILDAADILIKKMSVNAAEQVLKEIEEFYEMMGAENMEIIVKDIDPLLSQTLGGLERIKKVVLDLKSFTHANFSISLKADIHQIMDSAINICWNEIKYKVELIKTYGQIPLIECNEQKLNQVFINLLMNATQAIEGRGTIQIVTCLKHDKVCIQIIDNGKGILPEQLKRIFDPFFTTKPVGQGTGLGLSVSYDIIKQHGGEILVESTPEDGTMFTILLPVQKKTVALAG